MFWNKPKEEKVKQKRKLNIGKVDIYVIIDGDPCFHFETVYGTYSERNDYYMQAHDVVHNRFHNQPGFFLLNGEYVSNSFIRSLKIGKMQDHFVEVDG